MTLEDRLYRVDLSYACFGIVVGDDNVVTSAAPIGCWMVGKNLVREVVPWVVRRNGKIEQLPDPPKGEDL